MVASKFISADKKHSQSWQYSEKDSEAVPPMASNEKVKFTRKQLCRCLFLNKAARWKTANSTNRDSGTDVFQ